MTLRSAYFAVAILTPTFALAEEPTVTLTQAELQAIVGAQVTAALAQDAVQRARREAGAAEAKINAAFAPKKPPAPAAKP